SLDLFRRKAAARNLSPCCVPVQLLPEESKLCSCAPTAQIGRQRGSEQHFPYQSEWPLQTTAPSDHLQQPDPYAAYSAQETSFPRDRESRLSAQEHPTRYLQHRPPAPERSAYLEYNKAR